MAKGRRDLDTFEKHQLAIARKTLLMPDAILGVMGGMTKAQARRIVAELGPLPKDTLGAERWHHAPRRNPLPPRNKRTGRFMKRRR